MSILLAWAAAGGQRAAMGSLEVSICGPACWMDCGGTAVEAPVSVLESISGVCRRQFAAARLECRDNFLLCADGGVSRPSAAWSAYTESCLRSADVMRAFLALAANRRLAGSLEKAARAHGQGAVLEVSPWSDRSTEVVRGLKRGLVAAHARGSDEERTQVLARGCSELQLLGHEFCHELRRRDQDTATFAVMWAEITEPFGVSLGGTFVTDMQLLTRTREQALRAVQRSVRQLSDRGQREFGTAELESLEDDVVSRDARWPLLASGNAPHWSAAVYALADCFDAPSLTGCLCPVLAVHGCTCTLARLGVIVEVAEPIPLGQVGVADEVGGCDQQPAHGDDSDRCKSFSSVETDSDALEIIAAGVESTPIQSTADVNVTIVGTAEKETRKEKENPTVEPVEDEFRPFRPSPQPPRCPRPQQPSPKLPAADGLTAEPLDWQLACGLAGESARASILAVAEKDVADTPHTVLQKLRGSRHAAVVACRSELAASADDAVVVELPFLVSKSSLSRFLDWDGSEGGETHGGKEARAQEEPSSEDPVSSVSKARATAAAAGADETLGPTTRSGIPLFRSPGARTAVGALQAEDGDVAQSQCDAQEVYINRWLDDAARVHTADSVPAMPAGQLREARLAKVAEVAVEQRKAAAARAAAARAAKRASVPAKIKGSNLQGAHEVTAADMAEVEKERSGSPSVDPAMDARRQRRKEQRRAAAAKRALDAEKLRASMASSERKARQLRLRDERIARFKQQRMPHKQHIDVRGGVGSVR